MWIILFALGEDSSNILLLLVSLDLSWLFWFILSFIPILSSRILDQQCLWSLGPLGQLFDLSGSILPGGSKGCLENLSDDFWS